MQSLPIKLCHNTVTVLISLVSVIRVEPSLTDVCISAVWCSSADVAAYSMCVSLLLCAVNKPISGTELATALL
jgi:hypothetical protein